MKRYNPTGKNNENGNGNNAAVATPQLAAASPVPTVPPVTTPTSPLKKLSFGGIAKKKEDTKTAYLCGESLGPTFEALENYEAWAGSVEGDQR